MISPEESERAEKSMNRPLGITAWVIREFDCCRAKTCNPASLIFDRQTTLYTDPPALKANKPNAFRRYWWNLPLPQVPGTLSRICTRSNLHTTHKEPEGSYTLFFKKFKSIDTFFWILESLGSTVSHFKLCFNLCTKLVQNKVGFGYMKF